MIDKILRKAIEKAVRNGFSAYSKNLKKGSLDKRSWPAIVDSLWLEYHDSIIFNHDFAKAFWGKMCSDVCVPCERGLPHQKVWEENLQQMVLEKDPIKYLEKFL